MKNTLITVVIIVVLIAIGAYFYFKSPAAPAGTTPAPTATSTMATTTEENPGQTTIGTSVGGRAITAYHFGTGADEILFVGGIHGGYEWNTALVAYDLVDYLKAHPDAVPANEKVTVIPVVNPDGLAKIVGTDGTFTADDVPSGVDTVPGRFNGNNVDLNRNFDCDWQAKGTWQSTTVSGGTAAFSEPESKAIRDYVAAHPLTAAVVWYSAAGGVFASNCHTGVHPETATLTKVFADASGYPAHESFDFYAITGDMVNWLSRNDIPAISVLLTNHTDAEWDKNWKGIAAVLNHYAD